MSRLKTIDPATGELIQEYPETSPDEVNLRLKMAEETYAGWKTTEFDARAGRFRNLAKLLRGKKSGLAELMTREMGKPIVQAEAEIEKCAWVSEYYADEGEDFLQPEDAATDAAKSFVRFDPIGPILGIMPWNFPFWQAFRAAVPAIAAGNVFILKHANSVSGVSLEIERLFVEADFPVGVFSSVLLSRKRTEELIESPSIRGVDLDG